MNERPTSGNLKSMRSMIQRNGKQPSYDWAANLLIAREILDMGNHGVTIDQSFEEHKKRRGLV